MSGRFDPAFDIEFTAGRFPPAFDTEGILPPAAVTRYFTELTSGLNQYYELSSSVSVSRVVMDVYSTTSSNSGLPSGAPSLTANELQTIDFSHSGAIQEIGRNGASYFDGIIANVKLYDGSDNLVVDMPINEPGSTNAIINRAAVLGGEEWVEPFTLSGSDWVDNADGTFTRTGTTSGEVRKELLGYNDGDAVRVSFTSTGSSLVTIQFGGPPTDGKNRVQSIPAGDHVYTLTAESFAVNNNMRFISTGSDLTISNISIKQIPSTTPYAARQNQSAADTEEYVFNGSVSPNTWTDTATGTKVIPVAGT